MSAESRSSAMRDATIIVEHTNPMKLDPSPLLRQILKDNEDFFHEGQQTNRMLRENNRRTRLSHEKHQKSLLPLLLEHGYSWSSTQLQTKNLNPLDVTLTMQIFKDETISLYRRRSPDSLATIMKQTNTLIRFPDREDVGVLSCQVAISGSISGVEQARERIRALTTVSLSLPVEIENPEDLYRWLDLQRKSLPDNLFYETIGPQQKQMFEKPTIRVSGTLSQEKELATAVQHLRAAFYNRDSNRNEKLFVAELTIPLMQMEMYLGGERAEQLVAIARTADVYLHFIPIQGDRPHFTEFQNFIITGSKAEGVIHALKIMTSLQPVQMSFNVLGDDLVTKVQRDTTQKIYDEEFQVHNYVSPSMKQIHLLPEDPVIHFVCMTAQEHNVGNIYKYLKSFLREKILTDCTLPDPDVPSHMAQVLKQLHVTGRQLDIQNYEFPELGVEGVNEKGDLLLLERSVESDDVENPFGAAPTVEAPNGDSVAGAVVDPFIALQQESLVPYFNHDFNESYQRDVPLRGNREAFFDNSGFDHRGFSRGYRGRRGGGFYNGDRRGPPNRRFRDFVGKNDFPRGRNLPYNDDRPERNDKRYRNVREVEEPRQYNRYNSQQQTRCRMDDASLEGYMTFYMGPHENAYVKETGNNAGNAKSQRSGQDSWRPPRENWKPTHDNVGTPHDSSRSFHDGGRHDNWKNDSDPWRGRAQNKVLLANKKLFNDSHNSTREEEDMPKRISPRDLIDKANEEINTTGPANTSGQSDHSRVTYARMVGGEEDDMPKRISPRDLIDKANEEINTTGPANTSGQSEHSRITYARMVGGTIRKDGISEKGLVQAEGPSNERFRRRSFSSSEPSKKFSNYSHDSPFGRNARQLDCRVDVEHVLFSINCDKYAEQFRHHRISSLQDFARLNEADLYRIGVGSSLDRETILEYVTKMRQSYGRSNSNQAPAQSRSGPSAL